MKIYEAIVRDSTVLTIPLVWDKLPFAPGNDWALMFTAKVDIRDSDEDAVIQKITGAGITVDATDALIELVSVDSVGFERKAYVCDVRGQHVTDGRRRTFARFRLEFSGDVSQLTEASIPIYTTNPPVAGQTRVYNSTTESFYILTLTGAAGEEILVYTPEA